MDDGATGSRPHIRGARRLAGLRAPGETARITGLHLVRDAGHGAAFSGFGASGDPGAVHARRPRESMRPPAPRRGPVQQESPLSRQTDRFHAAAKTGSLSEEDCDASEQGMKVGFIGLGNLGGKLAGSLLRNGIDLRVLDREAERVADFTALGAAAVDGAAALMRESDVAITCLPSPAASAAVVSALLPEIGPGKVWLEMSTTDEAEIRRLAALVEGAGGAAVDCPVSGGCHRAATGNISIFAGCDRETFERVLPLLARLGRRVLHTGPIGSASTLKVMTNYLATANLLACCEALVAMKAAGIDLATTHEAVRISSGASFVHDTESQLILNGSRDVNFTMDLILKDLALFQARAERNGVPLELAPMIIDIMTDGQARYGQRANTDDIIRRLEEATGLSVLADGFPAALIDDEPEEPGYEVFPPGRGAADAAG